MSLVFHAEQELKRAGLFDKDSDYEGAMGDSVLQLVKVFAEQGHSGFSAHMCVDIFRRVATYQTLTPLGNPTETKEYMEHAPDAWQSTRDPHVFSDDQGKTWYHLDDHRKAWQKALAFVRRRTPIPIPFRWVRGRVV